MKILLDVQEGKVAGIIEVPKKDKASGIIRKEKHLVGRRKKEIHTEMPSK